LESLETNYSSSDSESNADAETLSDFVDNFCEVKLMSKALTSLEKLDLTNLISEQGGPHDHQFFACFNVLLNAALDKFSANL
jgi:hypothetical protein